MLITPRPKVRLRVMPALLPVEIQLQATATAIQWRYVGQDWVDLVPYGDIDATVAVGSVTTLAAGASATVVNSGTNKDMVLDFGIPRGQDGLLASIVAGTNITVDATDPANPIVSATTSVGVDSVNGATGVVIIDAGDIAFTPTGSIAASDVQAAISELGTEKQPLATELTALSAISGAAYGRGLLTYASEAAFKTGTGLADTAKLNVEDQVLTGGARVTSKSLGTPTAASTVTLDPGDRPLQHLTNNAAFTLEPGTNSGSILLEIVNGASAGAITTSGFTKVDGSFTTTSGHKFICSVVRSQNYSYLNIAALQ